jgi:hypothetical protein
MTSGVPCLIGNGLGRPTRIAHHKFGCEQDRSEVLCSLFEVIDQKACRDRAKLARWLPHNRQSRAQER